MQTRFGTSTYNDPMESLTRLKQTTSVVSYKGNFEILSNRIKGLSKSHKLSCILSGLKDEIRFPIRMLVPKSLNDEFGLTKIQEEFLISNRKSFKPVTDVVDLLFWGYLSWKAGMILRLSFHCRS